MNSKAVITDVLAPGAWWMFPRFLLETMDIETAVVVSFLFNKYRMRPDGWIPLPNEELVNTFRFSKKQLKRVMVNLKAVEFLRFKLIGMPARLHFMVDHTGVLESLPCRAQKGPTSRSEKGPTVLSPLLRKGSNINNNSGDAANAAATGESFEYKLATKLYELLKTHRRVMRKVSLHRWCQDLSALTTNEDQDQVKQVFKWYKAHFTDQYVPKCNSAKSFVEKYVNIKDAWERHIKENTKPTDSIKIRELTKEEVQQRAKR